MQGGLSCLGRLVLLEGLTCYDEYHLLETLPCDLKLRRIEEVCVFWGPLVAGRRSSRVGCRFSGEGRSNPHRRMEM